MSGITSAVAPIFSGIGSAITNTIASAPKDILTDDQLAKQQSQREAQAAAADQAKADQLSQQANQQELQRNQTLAKGLAHAKAYFAAQGIDPSTGSADALASANVDNTAELNNYTQQQLGGNITNLNQSLADLQSNDLLQRTQLQQRQVLDSWL